MDTQKTEYNTIKELAKGLGAIAFGVADIKEADFPGLDKAISLAVGLSRKVLEQIGDHPTKLYFHHYRQANNLLDHIAMRITQFIQESGYNALPVPASQIVDWNKQSAHLSHKAIAEAAGIGWLGRNNLIVHPVYGSHIRLITVLTDMPLPADKRMDGGCGDCHKCIPACPVAAIKESRTDFDHLGCFEKLKLFQKQGYTAQYICGICVKACAGEHNTPRP
ncbi:MAG: reductive dehalogenase domain-containing protein [Candidatus Omnitrophota bacterium]